MRGGNYSSFEAKLGGRRRFGIRRIIQWLRPGLGPKSSRGQEATAEFLMTFAGGLQQRSIIGLITDAIEQWIVLYVWIAEEPAYDTLRQHAKSGRLITQQRICLRNLV